MKISLYRDTGQDVVPITGNPTLAEALVWLKNVVIDDYLTNWIYRRDSHNRVVSITIIQGDVEDYGKAF